MGIIESITDEFNDLVDRPGGLTVDNLVHCPTIVALLAHGDAEQAYLVIDGIRQRNESRDVAAAFAHIGGFGHAGDNTEARLNDFAKQFPSPRPRSDEEDGFVATRTVRRWSASGRKMLAERIIHASGIEPPTVHLDVLRSNTTAVTLLPTIYHMHGYVMNDPLLIVVGTQTHTIVAFPAEELEQIGTNVYQPVNAVQADVGLPVHLLLIWQGEVQPTVVTRTIGFGDDLVQMVSMTAGACGVMLYRDQDSDAIDELAEVAAEIGRQHADAAKDLRVESRGHSVSED
ncbi:hypothetical protein BH93_27110 (plasmid) [Rhodococcoides fascians A25f]|uniref:hypothetical protein n=1 Tax=Rhodococcoides fascians TaxID=1828 RepID=UPI0012D31E31|nr:hypothetical protein [Rhodococcus fascians]QII09246.1 hypothetical protein BH93_27110 [Rhodococcus fascians A25f]